MQGLMPSMRRSSSESDAEMSEQIRSSCPTACLEESIDTEMSFTITSEDSHQRAWKLWQLPEGRSKEDAVFMELFYKTLDVEVTRVSPLTFLDLLSSVGGTLGLFLGGSIFSLIEFLLVTFFVSLSMLGLFLRTTFKIQPADQN